MMTDFLHIKDWFKIKKGDLVEVHTRGYHPQIDGIYPIKRVVRWSNYPYRVDYKGEEQLLEKREVKPPAPKAKK